MENRKKLIEVALPLDVINAESAHEKKSVRNGHPATLHLWWARRPLVTARAVIFSSLVDDPSSHPDLFPTKEEQTKERDRLFGILERLVKWENSNNEAVLAEAKAEIMKYTGGKPPILLDPFAGGGAIPLEAQRLGLEAHASDLNPVAVMINKAMIEIPPKFVNQPPVNPNSKRLMDTMWTGTSGLAEDVAYYGELMKKRAFNRIGHLYPKVRDENGNEYTVIGWFWSRTVKCPNPVCGCEMPLLRSFSISKKRGRECYLEPVVNDSNAISFHIKLGKKESGGTVNRSGASCIACGAVAPLDYLRNEAQKGNMKPKMVSIVAEGNNGRVYFPADSYQEKTALSCSEPENCPQNLMPEKALGFRVQNYGSKYWKNIFTNRQLTMLSTFCDLIRELFGEILKDAERAIQSNDKLTLSEGGKGAIAYAQAISLYLGFIIDKLADYNSTCCSWHASNEQIAHTFGRQTIPMLWDYIETNPFSNSSGSFSSMMDGVVKSISRLPASRQGFVTQHDAQSEFNLNNVMISTDPPYYDNIGYADLSDFFYIWLRQIAKDIYPSIFSTTLSPKNEELIATPFRFGDSMDEAKEFFERGMIQAFNQVYKSANEGIPVTIYYAFKQSEDNEDDNGIVSTSSTGWETILSAIIHAGFRITGTWPVNTERANRPRSLDSNALASSIVIVCRKRPSDAPTTTRRDFISCLKRELKPALHKLQMSNIAPVDLAQSAIGPGMSVYSSYSKVLEADGNHMIVRSALQIINQELDLYFTEQDGELDRESRFCVDLYTQYAFNDVKFGEADVLARAKNTSVEKMASSGLLYAQKGVVRLRTREEISKASYGETIWLLTQQLTRAIEKDGVLGAAGIVCDILTSEPEQAKALAYRLYTIAERKGWAGEAYAYNSLVVAWPEVQSKTAELRSKQDNGTQMKLFETDNK